MKISPYVFPGIRTYDLPKLSKSEKRFRVKPEDVLRVISEHCGVTTEQILSSTRIKIVADARHMYCAILRKEFGFSYKEIGIFNNGRDHTTSIHSCRTHNNRCETEEGYREHTQSIINKIYSLY